MKFTSAKRFYRLVLSLIERSWSGFAIMLIIWSGVDGYSLAALAEEPSFADESPSVIIRTSLEPENPVVGQQVEFRVDVFVDTWFAKATKFPEIKLDDAIALLPPTASINLNEKIHGKSYAGQRRTYFLFPQLPGRYVIPKISPTVVPARPGSSTYDPVSLSTPSVNFLALLPPSLAVQSDRSILAAPQLQLETQLKTQEVLDQTQVRLHTGDTLERTITLIAVDTLVSMMPAISITDIKGLSAYPDPPKLTNQFERGQFKARRTEHISYVAEQPGHYQLPEQTIFWWNTRTHSLETDTILAVEVWIKPTVQQMIIRLLPWLAGLLTILGILIYFRHSLQNSWYRFRQHRQKSEPNQWRLLRRACLNNDLNAAWFQLIAWLSSTKPSAESMLIENFLDRAHSSALTQAILELESKLFAAKDSTKTPSVWSGQALIKELSQIRKRKLSGWPQYFSSTCNLPPLNPTAQPIEATKRAKSN